MNTAALADLLARVEKAEGEDLRLDIDIWRAVAPSERFEYALSEFTGRVDAALALLARVLPEWWWLARSEDTGGAYANVGPIGSRPNEGGLCWPSTAKTPALALLAAMLKALIAKAEGRE